MLKGILKNFCLYGFLIIGFANAADGARDIWIWDDNNATPETLDGRMAQQEPPLFDD